jgi:hypothetical protein
MMSSYAKEGICLVNLVFSALRPHITAHNAIYAVKKRSKEGIRSNFA